MIAVRLAAAVIGIAAAVAALPAGARAQQMPNFVSELKFGGLAHDVTFLGRHVESGADVNLEVLFNSPDFLSIIGSPRPHLGGDINTSGNTSDGYFGLTWGVFPFQSWLPQANNVFLNNVFLNGSLGGALQDGYELTAPAGRKRLGSVILFRESAELGYQFTPTFNVSALLDHISNANLAPRNAGITSVGARFGFKF